MMNNCRKLLKKLPAVINLHLNAAEQNYSTSSTPLIVSEADGIREIILNEPTTRNTLSMSTMNILLKELTKNKNDEKLRCVVLSAKGHVFSAGHNLKELIDGGRDTQKAVFEKLIEIILNIYSMPVPVIAKVNNLVTAAGTQLVASCDIVVCSDKTTFSTAASNFGVFCSTPGIALARVMPHLKTNYMLHTGFPIDAQAAYVSGLVSAVVPESELDCEMKRITDSIIAKSRAVVALGKEFYYCQKNMSLEDAYKFGADKMVENLQMPDGVEGIKSFIEKRKPKWSHN